MVAEGVGPDSPDIDIDHECNSSTGTGTNASPTKRGGLKKATSGRASGKVSFYSTDDPPTPPQNEEMIFLNRNDGTRASATPEAVPGVGTIPITDTTGTTTGTITGTITGTGDQLDSVRERQKSLSRTNQVVVVPTELVLSHTGEVVQKSIMISKETPSSRKMHSRSASMAPVSSGMDGLATTVVPNFSKKSRRSSCTANTPSPISYDDLVVNQQQLIVRWIGGLRVVRLLR